MPKRVSKAQSLDNEHIKRGPCQGTALQRVRVLPSNPNPRKGAAYIGTRLPGARSQCVPQERCADASTVRAAARAGTGESLQASHARLGVLFRLGRMSLFE